MRNRWYLAFLFAGFTVIFGSVPRAMANDLSIANVRLGQRDPSAKTVVVLFDISWKNSWKNKINHDAAWVTIRLDNGTTEKKLCPMKSAGVNPSGFLPGSNTDAELYIPQDKSGVFVRRAKNSPTGDFLSTSVSVVLNYAACGFSETEQVSAHVFALEMVLVPEGAFYAGDAVSNAALRQGSADSTPWSITSEAPINVGGNGTYYYVSGNNAGETPSGSTFVIPQNFPKGFAAFYAMKYEITEGEWVEFLNSLPAAQRTAHDLTDASHKNTDNVLFRNTLACSGSPLTCTTQRPSRALAYLTWPDICAFLDWAALRPMTELEYEKAARGPYLPVPSAYAWGVTTIAPGTTLSGTAEDGTEHVSDPSANAVYGNQVLAGGDTANGPDHQQGPLRIGVFGNENTTRTQSGGGNYGMMELSGNVKEWVVTIGNASGLAYDGSHGNGFLTSVSGHEGYADNVSWPGIDVVPANGVTASSGAGLRGGSWADDEHYLRVSDRTDAAAGVSLALPVNGGRGVRTLDAQ